MPGTERFIFRKILYFSGEKYHPGGKYEKRKKGENVK
jgi:hypothetical protein